MTGLSRQIILLAATALTLVMNYLSSALPLFGNSNAEVSGGLPNAFTPAGVTFAVWGPIFLGLVVLAVYQALPAQRGPRLDRLFWPFLLSNLFNISWLLAFQSLNLLPVPWVQPEDVAEAVLYLAADSGRYVTGGTHRVDAGWNTK